VTAPFDPRRIRLVASRYYEMQGLRMAGDASLLMLAGAGMRAVVAIDTMRVVVAVLLVWLVWAYAWLRRLRPRLEPYYATRFGRVGAPMRWHWPGFPLHFMVGTGWINAFGTMPLHGPMWVIAPLALWPVIPLAAYPGWIARRDFPVRWHWAVVAIVTIVLGLRYPFGAPDSFHGLWRAHSMLYGGMALAFAGLCDHAVLVRVLRGPGASEETESEGA
jgi:hypothetical protein